jgi:hypothetical protein
MPVNSEQDSCSFPARAQALFVSQIKEAGTIPAGARNRKGEAEIRAAVEYLLRGTTGGARGDIVQEILAIVREAANGPPREQPNPLDDDMPGG